MAEKGYVREEISVELTPAAWFSGQPISLFRLPSNTIILDKRCKVSEAGNPVLLLLVEYPDTDDTP